MDSSIEMSENKSKWVKSELKSIELDQDKLKKFILFLFFTFIVEIKSNASKKFSLLPN